MSRQPEPIAVIGTACRFPGNADSPSKLWDLLQDPVDVQTAIPDDRFGAAGFYHESGQYHGHSNVKSSYLLAGEGTHRRFDAEFFGMRAAEAHVVDPQMRLLMETAYEALEAAGLPMEELRGSNTAVYAGLMMADYEQVMLRDGDDIGTYHATGITRSLMSNRLSYFFDWHGPSMTIDTACSSSLVAVHQAVQQLRSGQSHVAIAAGANLILDPQYFITESKLQMLSPTGRSRMWDADADGYARGEGIAVMVLKTLTAALADGDDIECVIRETGINQDGRTRGITMPSAEAQARLIHGCYERAGLDLAKTSDRPQYFEAHGTGTPAGDPVEAEAIRDAFFSDRFDDGSHPVLHVGSIKTVIGHTEGTAGLASLMKASLALQNATIPPNLLFNKLNSRILPFYSNLMVPTSRVEWPLTGPRRASVNSFGFGGTNAHAILEAHLPQQGPCVVPPESPTPFTPFTPFVFSASSENRLASYLTSFRDYLKTKEANNIDLDALAYTLHTRRSRLLCGTAISASSAADLCTKIDAKVQASHGGNESPTGVTIPRQQTKKPVLLGIFTGQGAQWARMGSQLLASSKRARRIIESLEARLGQLPAADRPTWSLTKELGKDEASSRLGEAHLSQPLCTAVQILQVDLLSAAGVKLAAVVGHSSGEIAAAYAAGRISAGDAICIAYYRGMHASLARGKSGQRGAMMAVGSSFDDVHELCDMPEMQGRACIAAVNSSTSMTVSGDVDAIEELQTVLADEKKFARQLRVDKAYHSPHMVPCSEPYRDSLRRLTVQVEKASGNCVWVSSVHVDDMAGEHESLTGPYWDDNMTKPVLFMQAMEKAYALVGPVDLVIEVGPHPALKGPALQNIREVLTNQDSGAAASKDIPHTGLLRRGSCAIESFAQALGYLWTHQPGAVSLYKYHSFVSDGSPPPRVMKGLPRYAWDHEAEYWHESRYARAIRTRHDPPHPILGHMTPDSTKQEMRWRHLIRPSEILWLQGHQLQNQIVFPAAGYVVAALEAARGLARDGAVRLVEVTDLDISRALTFDDEGSGVETLVSLTDITPGVDQSIEARFCYSAASNRSRGSLDVVASGRVRVLLGESSNATPLLPSRGSRPTNLIKVQADRFYTSLADIEYGYSGPFRALSQLERRLGAATGCIMSLEPSEILLLHPAVIDAAFQSALLASCAPGDGRLSSMHVPRTIRSVRVDVGLLYASDGASGSDSNTFLPPSFPFDATQPHTDRRTIGGDVDVYSPSHTDRALIQVEGLECVPFSLADAGNQKEVFYTTVWDVASPDVELVAHDGRASLDQHTVAVQLERASVFYIRALEREVPSDHATRSQGPYTSLFRFADEVLARTRAGDLEFWQAEWEHDTAEQVAAALAPYRDLVDVQLLQAMGPNLASIARGEKQAIEIGMRDNLLSRYYEAAIGIASYTCYLARTVRQLVHSNPGMRILEVGAGTGSATKRILGEIGTRFATYTFTDVSSGFFSAARAVLADPQDKISYRVLDISRDPGRQGFDEAAYDLVVASMVLHATPRLEETMRSVRKLLRPGGRLVVLEGHTQHTSIRAGAMFGAFPGWWLGADDGRITTPCLGKADWEALLRRTSFSGCDTATTDRDPLAMPTTLFVSTAVDDRITFLRQPLLPATARNLFGAGTNQVIQDLVLVGAENHGISLLVGSLHALLKPHCSGSIRVISSVGDLASSGDSLMSSATTVLSVSDLDESLFERPTPYKWEGMKQMLLGCCTLLWVTQGRRADRPHANMTVGLLRSAARELPSLAVQCLDVEDIKNIKAHTLVEALLRMAAAKAWRRQDGHDTLYYTATEPELVLGCDGRFMVPRLIASHEMNERYKAWLQPILTNVELASLENVGLDMADGDDEVCALRPEPLPPTTTTTKLLHVTHSTLSAVKVCEFVNLFVVLGRREDGSGEQKVALATQQARLVRSWEDVAAPCTVPRGSEAEFLSLVAQNLLVSGLFQGLRRGQTILAHEPPPAIAAWLAREAKLKGLEMTYSTCEASIYPERDTDTGWLRFTSTTPQRTIHAMVPKKISLYLDFSTESGHQSVGARLARHVPARARRESLETMFPRDVWLLGEVDVSERLRESVARAAEAISAGECNLSSHAWGGTVHTLASIHNTPVAAPGLAVVDWTTSSVIPIQVQPADAQVTFSPNKTYWLVGLTGGLGLSLCEWMVQHGARHVVLSSRRPKIDPRWLTEMSAVGAVIKVFSCDVTQADDVAACYRDICTTLPPVAGVAQGAMVLQDTPLHDLSLDVLLRTTRPKVEGSMHLNALFPHDTLDFFVFFSSVAAVVGNPGQANYAAANLFMTSLAEQRRRSGLAASVMHIGPVMGVGYMAQEENVGPRTMNSRTGGFAAMSERDFHQQFAEAVLASRSGSAAAEITAGLRKVDPQDDVQPGWASNPFLRHCLLMGQDNIAAQAAVYINRGRVAVPLKTQLAGAHTRTDVSTIVRDAFLPVLCGLFQVTSDRLAKADLATLRLDEMGIDSLLAVEIRVWFVKTFQVNIPVLKILNGAAVGELITIASETLPPALVPALEEKRPDSKYVEANDEAKLVSLSSTSSSDSDTETPERSSSSRSPSPASGYTEALPTASLFHGTKISPVLDQSPPAVYEEKTVAAPMLEQPTVQKSCRLSFSQDMFWFMASYWQDKTSLNHSAAFRMTGVLRAHDLSLALEALAKQHEPLRTCFGDDKYGPPTQQILESSVLRLEQGRIHDASEVEPRRQALQDHVFDLRRGETMRMVLLTLTPTVHFLVVAAHGLAMDGMSFQVLMYHLQQLYTQPGRRLSVARPSSVYYEQQRADYASGNWDAALRFWKAEFSRVPPPLPILTVSAAATRPALTACGNERVDVRINASIRARIQTVCQHHHATAFHFYLAVFRALLARFNPGNSGSEDDVVIGIGDANRLEHGMMDNIGNFLNVLPLRWRAGEAVATTPFTSLLKEGRRLAYQALEHSQVPFQVLLSELDAPRSASHTPMFQCFVDYRQGQREKTAWADCQLEMLSFEASRSPYDIALDIIDNPEADTLLMLVVRNDVYGRAAAESLATAFRLLVEAFAADPQLPIDEPAALNKSEATEALRLGRGAPFASEWPETLVHRIEQVAHAQPDVVAVISDNPDHTATYADILRFTMSLTSVLSAKEVVVGSRIAVLQEPTAAWVCSILAVMRLGAVYLPLDPGTPRARLSAIVQAAAPSVIIVDDRTKDEALGLGHPDMSVINVSKISRTDASAAKALLAPIAATAAGAAAILYTSGSTGVPQGIILRHEGLRNWIEPCAALYGLGAEAVLQQSACHFDMSLTQIFTALCFGGHIYLLPRALRVDARAVSEAVAAHSITYTCATPSEYLAWLQHGRPDKITRRASWTTAVCAGEPVTTPLLHQLAGLGMERLRFYNMYGPTEISLVATAIELPYCQPIPTISVGYVLPNYSVYVLDEKRRLVAPGVRGEIYVGGAGVAVGYLDRDDLTSERFMPDIFAGPDYRARGWTTMHRTGDIGRWSREDGTLLIEGRTAGDTQIKLRGLRIDLAEVEHAILEASATELSAVVVTVRHIRPESPDFLVAHVVFDVNCRLTVAERQAFLRALPGRLPLPQYMLPAVVLALEAMPRTSTGKLDRRSISTLSLALEENDHDNNGDGRNSDTQSCYDLTETESLLKGIWNDVLPAPAAHMSGIDGETDFFHVGGTSLLLLRLQARLRTVLGTHLAVVDMFRDSTLGGMARQIDRDVQHNVELALDWELETALPPEALQIAPGGVVPVCPRAEHDASVASGMEVVLTGATGFLGRALLDALVEDPRVQRVHCIAVRHLSNRAEIVGLHPSKAVFYDGDLILPRLGLSEADAREVFAAADIVIHNGADVSYLKSYKSLRRANIDSTKALLALCLPRLIPFHYISTAGVGVFAAAVHGPQHVFRPVSVAKCPPPDDVAMLAARHHTYEIMTATKWASERVIERAHDRFPQWPIWIHRPGSIERTVANSHGDAERIDLMQTLRHFARRLHAVPVLGSRRAGGALARGSLVLGHLDTAVAGMTACFLSVGAGEAKSYDGGVRFRHYLGGVELPLEDLRGLATLQNEDEDDAEDAFTSAGDGKEKVRDLRSIEELPLDVWSTKAAEQGMHPAMVALLETVSSSGGGRFRHPIYASE